MTPYRFSALVAVLATIALSAGCGEEAAPSEDATLRIYVSLPLSGPSSADGRDAADGARLALADVGGEVAGYAVEAEFLDDTEGDGADAVWTPARAAANARSAIRDSTAIAYVGEFESGATRASLPITNGARMLQVSPASSATDLVAPVPGSDDVPDVQHSGERTFGRVIPSDDAQARAGARWAAELGWRRIRVRKDGTPFGTELANAFEVAVGEEGLDLVRRTFAPFTYLAGGKGLLAAPGNEPINSSGGPPRMGTDALLSPYAGPLPSAAPVYATSAALDPTQLPAAGQDFVERFEAEYGRAPGRYAAYGYEAMAVVLGSIASATDPADRQAVVEAFFEISSRDSILGPYSITETGETTLAMLTGYEVRDGRAEPVAELEIP